MWLLLLAQLAQPAKPPPAKPKPAPTTVAAKPAEAPSAAPAASPAAEPADKGNKPAYPIPASGASASAASGAPVTLADPKDPRTSGTTLAEGTGVLPIDPRTTRDDQFDPRASAQAEEERREAAARVLRAQQSALGGSRVRLVDPDGQVVQHRPLEITTAASIIGGYNSNVITTDRDGKRAAIYTSLEGRVELDFWGKGEEPQQVSLQVLGTEYAKLDGGPTHPADGSVLALYGGGFALGKSTRFAVRALTSVQTLNSSRQQDGALFLLEPNQSSQRTFTLSSATLQLLQEISPTTRYAHVAGATAVTTISDTPAVFSDGSRIFHRGLDAIQFNTSGTVLRDFGQAVRGFADVEYEGLYNAVFDDFTRRIPVRRGDFSVHVGRVNAGSTVFLSDALSTTARAGVAVASPPSSPCVPGAPPTLAGVTPESCPTPEPGELDPSDRSLIVSPQLSGEALYQKPTFDAQLGASYTFGSANPRLGYGRTVAVEGHVGGIPFSTDKVLKNVAVLFTATASRAVLRGSFGEGKLTFVGMTALVRYRLTNWLGALGGYSGRYVNLAGDLAAPDFVRHQVFLGLSGFFTTDQTAPPPLTVFAPPRPTG